ncbi:MAG: NAD(P)/FAD-dependent oxidoreductase, partial [Desulfovibrio sp.]|nr:NAD(P)/FAD-dependent oxidoreductase [Desulfovibrio sp.]
TIDFLPGSSLAEIMDARESSAFRSLLRKILPVRLADALAGDSAEDKIARLSRKARNKLAASVKAAVFNDLRPGGFTSAEVARGGVAVDEIDGNSLESRLIPGLYLAGEIIDVTGALGGYNLHWAFAGAKICQDHINSG